jgi:hypothetical protein
MTTSSFSSTPTATDSASSSSSAVPWDARVGERPDARKALTARGQNAYARSAHRGGCSRDRQQEPLVCRHCGQGDYDCRQRKAAERESRQGRAAPPGEPLLGTDPPPLVDRPRCQLAAEQEKRCHEGRAPVVPTPCGGNGRDVRRTRDEECGAEAAASKHERHDEEQRTEDGARQERDLGRGGADERVGENAGIRRDRSEGGYYAGRARCLNAFTSSRGTASGTPSRQVTTGTPTCS